MSEPVRRRRIQMPEPPTPKANTYQRAQQRIAENKIRYLAALEKHLGILSYAAEEIGISRRVIYNWMDEDPEFAESVREVERKKFDFVERKLMESIKDGTPQSIIFFMKCKGRPYGYVPYQEFSTPKDNPMEVRAAVDITQARAEMSPVGLASAMKAAMAACPELFNDDESDTDAEES